MPPLCVSRRSPRQKPLSSIVYALLLVGWHPLGAAPLELQPLAPAQAETPLFSVLKAEQTGLHAPNDYDDPRMWGQLYQEFLFGAIGTGVAIGDYDGDGRPDVFIVSKTGACHLFRNLGDDHFSDVTRQAGLDETSDQAKVWKQGVTFVDINNDGKLDLYICRFNAPNLLYINQGDGTFKEMAHAYGLDVVDACGMASFADYDRDGWLDVYIATNLLDVNKSPKGQRGYLFHNNGNGTFTNVTDLAGIRGETQSHSATWWDFDGDGWPDLYVANDYGLPDKLYRNNHDGTFADAIDEAVPHTSFASMGSDTGDVNNDGRIDLLVADMAGTTHEKFMRNEADVRSRQTNPEGRGRTTLKYGHNALLLNTGTGHFLEAAFLAGLAATDWTWSVRWEDFDNDGRLDLFVTNGMIVEQNTDVHNRIISVESPAERIAIMHNSPELRENKLLFRNLGDLRFENVSQAWGGDQSGISFGAATGDLSGTGNEDIVYSNYHDDPILLRNRAGGHRALVALRGTRSNAFGIGSLVRIETASGQQTRQLWLARGYMSSSEPVLHFGLGADKEIRRLTVTWPSGAVQVFEHIPADHRLVITEPKETAPPSAPENVTSPPLFNSAKAEGLDIDSPEESVDEATQEPLLPFYQNRRGPALAVAYEKSGAPLVVLGGTTLTPFTTLIRSKDGSFHRVERTEKSEQGPTNDGPVLMIPIDRSGQLALIVTKGGNVLPDDAPEYQPQVFKLSDSEQWVSTPNVLPAIPINAGALAAADYDHDGLLDLFIGGRVSGGQYPVSPRSALLANHDGKFVDVTDQIAPALRSVGMVTSALWSDVDGDGWSDLLLTVDWGFVRYFHNDHGAGFSDWSARAGFSSAGTGWWTSIASADFNGDGRPDFVVGNAGLNTQYRATPEHPAVLFYGDFKEDGSTQLLEGYYEGDRLYPWRSLRELSHVIPTLRRRYPTNNQFAKATIPEIVGEKKLAELEKVTATELRSGVFLSQADGTYRFTPLPRIAQIAPLKGIVAGDVDGDGKADIYAVQNSYSPSPAVGRFDSGLSQLLLGNGDGTFRPIDPQSSGLVVPGDGKALVTFDWDDNGRPDFLISRNDDTTLAFRNASPAQRHFLRVRLHGARGNEFAIGALVTVFLENGLKQVGEVHSTSSYYSQSAPDLFFGAEPPHTFHHVIVRWPRGQQSEADIAIDETRVELSEPER